MKKSLIFLFSGLFLFTISIGLMACGKHVHSCTEWLDIVEPTCTLEGSKTGICDDCGEEFTITLAKIAHAPVPVLGKEATCEDDGLSDGEKCSVCNTILKLGSVIPALGHDWDEWTVVNQADCTHLGQQNRDCKRCFQVDVEDIPTTPHNFDEWKVRDEATCVAPGLQYHTCQDCQHEETQIIEMIDHHFDDNAWQTGLEATCTQQGTEINICTICKIETKTRLTDMKPHTKEKILGQEPTCEDEGWTDGEKCSVCNTILQPRSVIPANGHKWSAWQKDSQERKHKRVCDTCATEDKEDCLYANEVTVYATCLEDGYTTKTCQECGDVIETDRVEKLGHKYENWIPYVVADEKEEGHTHKHYRDCVRCKDEEYRQVGDCQLSQEDTVQATCTTDGYIKHVCSECGVVHEEITDRAKGHSLKFVNQTTGYSSARHRQVCQNEDCDYATDWQDCKIYEYIVQATCTTDAISRYSCSICNLKSRDISHQGTAYGHRYSAWTHTGTQEHPQHTQTCLNNCGYSYTEDCQMESVETLPTCTNAGEIKKTCNKCFTSYTEEGKVSVGHKWDSWTKDVASGQHKHTCQECHITEYGQHDYVTTEIIPASCTDAEKIISKCQGCQDEKTEISTEHPALGHAWIISSISKDMHSAKCNQCQEERKDLPHNWNESNLCSVCQYDGLDYEIEGTHCYVIGDSRVASSKKIEIPEKHKNLLENGQYDTTEYTVKGIKNNAFYGNKNITSLLFPATVEFIDKYAFATCFNLVDVEIEGDTSALTRIENNAFLECWSLVSFECPDSVTKIGDYAFNNCKSLSKITISDNVTEIGSNAFSETAYVKDSTHWNGEILYLGKHLIKARHHMLDDGTFSNKEVVVKPGTLTIAAKAFSECENLEKLTIPNSITFIDSNAFLNCKSINHVEFNGDLNEWLAIEFVNDYSSPLCYGQTGLHIEKEADDVDLTKSPRPITKIPAGTFKNTGIKSIKFSKTVTYIGEEAFMNCAQLKSIEFEDGCKITYVGVDAFTGSAYYLDEENNWTDDVLYIGTMLIKAKTTLADEYNIIDGTTVVADYAFEGCNLLTSVIIDDAVERVGVEAFKGCSSMRNVTFENTEYIWIVTIKDKISRGFDKDDLNWNSLQAYNGGWKRAYKNISEKLN